MTDQRSTRRHAAPDCDPEVSSIIDEIEDVVVSPSAQIANTKQPPDRFDLDDAARVHSSDSVHVNDDDDAKAFDIDELEQELDVAIAAELGETPEQAPVQANEEPPEPERTPEPIATPAPEPAEAVTPPQRLPRPRRSPRRDQPDVPEQATSTGPTHTLAARILAPCTRPVERLSPNARMLLNIVVISTALWVPLVWFMATTDGFGFTHTVQLPDVPLKPTAIASEPAADH